MTFSLFQFAMSKLVPNKAMVPACIMQLQKTQVKHQSRLVVHTYTISDIYIQSSFLVLQVLGKLIGLISYYPMKCSQNMFPQFYIVMEFIKVTLIR